MVRLADVNISGSHQRILNLRVAFQAEVHVAFHQHLGVDRTVRRMTNGATLAQSLMFIDNGLGLFTVALGTVFIEPCHRQTAVGFHDVRAMWVVALNAVHLILNHRMMLWQVELCMDLQMTIEACRRILARIDNEFPPSAADSNMFATRSVAGLAACGRSPFDVVLVKAGMRTARECTSNVGVTLGARRISHVMGAGDVGRLYDRALKS